MLTPFEILYSIGVFNLFSFHDNLIIQTQLLVMYFITSKIKKIIKGITVQCTSVHIVCTRTTYILVQLSQKSLEIQFFSMHTVTNCNEQKVRLSFLKNQKFTKIFFTQLSFITQEKQTFEKHWFQFRSLLVQLLRQRKKYIYFLF